MLDQYDKIQAVADEFSSHLTLEDRIWAMLNRIVALSEEVEALREQCRQVGDGAVSFRGCRDTW